MHCEILWNIVQTVRSTRTLLSTDNINWNIPLSETLRGPLRYLQHQNNLLEKFYPRYIQLNRLFLASSSFSTFSSWSYPPFRASVHICRSNPRLSLTVESRSSSNWNMIYKVIMAYRQLRTNLALGPWECVDYYLAIKIKKFYHFPVPAKYIHM